MITYLVEEKNYKYIHELFLNPEEIERREIILINLIKITLLKGI